MNPVTQPLDVLAIGQQLSEAGFQFLIANGHERIGDEDRRIS